MPATGKQSEVKLIPPTASDEYRLTLSRGVILVEIEKLITFLEFVSRQPELVRENAVGRSPRDYER